MGLHRLGGARGLALVALLVFVSSGGLAEEPAAPSPAGSGTPEAAPEPVPGPGVPEPLLEADDPDPLFDGDADLLEDDEPMARDPWEGVNRGVFAFNNEVDRFVLDPVTRAYQFVVPEAGRRAVQRFFLNLDAPVVFANQVLQLRLCAAAVTLGRFVVNSTAGVGGLFDAASEGAGVHRIEADFGQTLARYGTPSGPYVMLPLFGPSTLRDTVGGAVDAMGDPLTYLIGPFQWWTLILGTGEGIVVREAHVRDLRELEEGSIDFYSALRSAYLQSREARIREAKGKAAVELAVQGE